MRRVKLQTLGCTEGGWAGPNSKNSTNEISWFHPEHLLILCGVLDGKNMAPNFQAVLKNQDVVFLGSNSQWVALGSYVG